MFDSTRRCTTARKSLTGGTRLEAQPRTSDRSGSQRGSVILEAAIVMPLLLVLILGILEAGRAMMVQQTLTSASQYGARVAMVQSSTVQDVYNAVDIAMSDAGISGSYETTITPNPPSAANLFDPITVGVSVDYANVSFGLLPELFLGLTLQGRTSMARE